MLSWLLLCHYGYGVVDTRWPPHSPRISTPLMPTLPLSSLGGYGLCCNVDNTLRSFLFFVISSPSPPSLFTTTVVIILFRRRKSD